MVIPGDAVGGTEKGFALLWLHLRSHGLANITLGISKELFQHLIIIPELQRLVDHMDAITFIPWFRNKLKQMIFLNRYVAKHPARRFHFAIWHPLWLKGKHSIYSFTANSLAHYRNGAQYAVRHFVRSADIVDVLDPIVLEDFKKSLRETKGAIYLSRNTFLNAEAIPRIPLRKKRNWLVFAARFIPEKQVCEFVRAIPAIYTALRSMGIEDIKFFVCGHGPEESKILHLVQEFLPNIPVEVSFRSDLLDVLAYSKVFYSLQRYNNYPSNSLTEAIASANMVVATDCGTTRMLAREEFSKYVPEKFSAGDLVAQTRAIFATPDSELHARMQAARDFIRKEATIDHMAAYYLELYNHLHRVGLHSGPSNV